MMEDRAIIGYVQFALDKMYLYKDFPLSDTQRKSLELSLYMALDYLTEEEAVYYYNTHANTNIKEV